ncbi:YEATS domain-containing protein [Ooceraea biroi]|uniref:YEATS domain-containing protein n=1 Tax=Ooceraea biroi TaxID=2015173 RepID=A0A026WD97_OOCBI|nr:YEATS domain-containing protein [Ooceraea biroi]
MSAPEESLSDQDPDYVSAISNNQAQQKIYEENARNTTARKITAIVEKEFSLEIDLKEKEVLEIQERLHQALKIFHLLRYAIISNFYNHKQCQVSQTSETTKQTRIHPAVKSLLGKSPKPIYCTDFAVPSTSKDPRFLCNDESLASDAKTTTDSAPKVKENACERDKVPQDKKRALPSEEESRPRKVPRYVPPKSSIPETVCPSRGNSHKVRERIIVGNISKWIPSDWREDSSSHKWTMYVRGDKDNADISAYVSKVRFFLHPSYHPKDVVEVTAYPFHLSRRGWGEFSVRVQLHFKNPLDKPIDIIHHLKLDRTYTGLQTLGSETLVDVWINTTESRNLEQSGDNKSIESSTDDDVSVKLEPSEEAKGSKGTSRLTAGTFERARVKQEIVDNSEVCELSDSMLYLTKNSEDAKIKFESSNGLTLQEVRHYVQLDHDYFGKQCSGDPYHCIVNEGNVTIEHCLGNNHVSAVDSPVIPIASSEKKTSDDATVVHRFNGSIKPSSDLQITDSVIPDVAKSESMVPQESHSRGSPILFDSMTISQAKYSQHNSNSKILENASARDATNAINGFRKSPDVSLDRLGVQRVPGSSKCNSHLRPLEITIPPPNVLAPSNKHVLLLKDRKSIPLDVTSFVASRKKLVDGSAKVPLARNNNAKVDVHIPHGISILKKPFNTTTNAQHEAAANNSKKTAVLTLKNANSILLNVNEDVPILKIVDPADPRYNYNLTNATRLCSSSEPSTDRQESCARLEKPTVQRAKITLGKDKHKIQSKRDLYEAVLRSIDTANITDTEALIRYVIRRLPIVTSDACDSEYKRLHPYACRSEEEFFAYNVGKQRASEWYRARTIKYFLQRKSIPADQLWSVKEIVLWARLHGHTPIRSAFNVPTTAVTKGPPDASTSAVLSTCTDSAALQKWLQGCRRRESNHQLADGHVDVEEIDVEGVEGVPACRTTIDRRKNDDVQSSGCRSASSALLPLELDEGLLPLHNFVCDTARDSGVEIGSEEIVPGVQHCATSRVIMRVIECFVEDLARSSLARAWERNSSDECPKSITSDDVRSALMSREEFHIFTNEGLGSRQRLNATDPSSL